VRWLVRRYYPRIEITGVERIPQTGPVLLCANHANALLDPILVGIAARRPVRFMAKAPLFDSPVLGPPMKALGMIPVFRGSDDSREVRKNLESLDVGAKVLVDGSAMGIFPEGKSTDQAHLEMVRSGAARMALQACEEGAAGILVVPIGISYERKEEFRSAVWIQVGEPIDVDGFLKQHDGNVRKARRALTQELESRLKEVVIHLDEPQWEPWLDDLETLAEAPGDLQPLPPLKRRKRIADAMNYFLANDRPRAESVAGEIESFRNGVRSAGLRIDSPALRPRGLKFWAEWLWSVLSLMLFFLPALAGTLHHLAPFVAVRGLASRLQPPGRQVISSYRLLVGAPVYLIWYIAVGWWMFGYFAPWFAWSWLAAAPLCGIIACHYWRRGSEMAQRLWRQARVTVLRKSLTHLRQQESELCGRLTELAEEYAKTNPRPEPPVQTVRSRHLPLIAKRALIVLALGAVAWVARYRLFDDPLSGNGLDLSIIPRERIQSLLASDEKVTVQIIERISRLESDAAKIHREFIKGDRLFTKQGDNDDIRELMRRFLTYRKALLRIVWKYQRYSDIEDERLRLRTFLLDFTAAATLYQSSLKFVHQFGDRSDAVSKLNEGEPNWGIPPGLYDTIRHNLASPQNISMFETARQYYHQDHVQNLFESHGLATDSPYDQLHTAISVAERTILKTDDSVSERIVEVAVTDIGRLIHDVQYETQSAISMWIGDLKIRKPHQGKSLIDEEQLARLADVLEPGDILLERRNWYLSNAFLPGYWPHGAVYVGTAEDLRERGLDKEEFVSRHWEEFAAGDDQGHGHVIIEAVSEGVVFSSLEHSIGGADSVAVLRPNVSDQEKNEAIVTAFSFAGRPYDFEFDFETTDMLVCTEVVFRTYGGNSGVIQFPLEEIMGRQTMPAINLVQKFDREYGTDAAQFEFVAFIDGDEQTESSRFVTDVQEFRDTVDRPASSFTQGSDPFALKSIGHLGRTLLSLTVLAAIVGLATTLTRRVRSSDETPAAAP
jgi:1-acyl-sn-glycerol-3-phosphate acyltransferase